MWTQRWVARDPKQVVEEIKHWIARYQVTHVEFYDLTAIVKREWIIQFAQLLIEQDLIASVRGRNGGLRLNKPPAEINVGRLIRRTEPGWDLVECFDAATNTCPIDGACALKGALQHAQRAFLGVLDEHTLADFLPRAPVLIRLLNQSLEAHP